LAGQRADRLLDPHPLADRLLGFLREGGRLRCTVGGGIVVAHVALQDPA